MLLALLCIASPAGILGSALIAADSAQRSGLVDRVTCTKAACDMYQAAVCDFSPLGASAGSRAVFDVFSNLVPDETVESYRSIDAPAFLQPPALLSAESPLHDSSWG
jgi:hypothetical protein